MKRALFVTTQVIALLLLAMVAAQPLWQASLPWSADGQLHFWRIVELDHCLRQGYLYPRWMPDMAYGYGYPLLNYYAPLSVYLAEGLHLLGLDFTAALLAALTASLALGALGAYLWARDTFGEAGGLIAALVYTYAPYTLYDAIWRGNLAESLALGLLPWVFWRLRRLALAPTPRRAALAALAFAGLTLSHNITALIAAPLLIGYALLLWLPGQRSRRGLRLLAGALALGLLLAAFFWLPAFFERSLVHTERMIHTSHFDYRHNFLPLAELFSPPAPVDTRLMNLPVPRSLSWAALALAAWGLLASWKMGLGLRRESAGILLAGLLCAILTLPASRCLWSGVPLLPYVGFPWRFLGPAGLAVAWLAGASMRWLAPWPSGRRALAVGLATLFVVLWSLTWLYPRYLEPIQNPTPAGLIEFERQSGAPGTTSVAEYLPIAVQELPETTALLAQYRAGGPIQRLAVESLPQGATLVSPSWRLVGGDFTVHSPVDWTATLRLFHFAGWRVTVNGQPVESAASSPHGLLQFPAPAGEARVQVRFGPTPWRLAGTALSVVGLVVWLTMAIRKGESPMPPQPPVFHRATRPVWIAALGVVALILGGKILYLDRHDSPLRYAGFDGQQVRGVDTSAQAVFAAGFRLLGHDPAAPTVEAGGALRLRLYWTADAPPTEEYGSFLHLLDAAGHLWAQSDHQHPGGYPTTRWRPGEYNLDEHALLMPPGMPPGQYSLRAGLVRRDGPGLDALDAQGAPVGTSVVVGAVAVTPPSTPPSVVSLGLERRLDAPLGPLTLLEAKLDRAQAAPGETLLLTLYWQAQQKPELDYAVAVEMVASAGPAVAHFSLPAVAPSFPTSLWRAGESLQGQHWLTLPADLASGRYTLRLQLVAPDGHSLAGPVELAQVTVVAPERQMTIPPMMVRLAADFGGQIALLGYDRQPAAVRAGETLHLTLYWRASQQMSRSYAVFVHLLDAAGSIVAGHDGLPANWTRPTGGWLPGEVIADAHDLLLPAGLPPAEYTLEVGLYDAETLIRLPLLDTTAQPVGDRLLLDPVTVER
ncbi:MAG: 6-pyruvoyl-tetrahydropterin synthase-related protein [Chloroflexota bacterium]